MCKQFYFVCMQVTDDVGATITIADAPQRIVSLVPSLTELLYSLGLEDEVVGITKFCVHPQHWFRTKTRIGGTKNPDIEKIKSLQPQLIIASKEENRLKDVAALRNAAPVYVTDIHDLDSASNAIKTLGNITGKKEEAVDLCRQITQRFQALPQFEPLSAVYLIWQEPIMTVGGDTFIHSMMQHCGFLNAFATGKRYPQLSKEELIATAPQVLLLSSEPYPFKENHVAYYQSMLPQTKVMIVDGELFSWYGSRLLHTPAFFEHLRKTLD